MINNRSISASTAYIALVFALLPIGNDSTQAESWTDLSGTRTVEAEMVGLWNDNLVLRLQDGRRISVRLSALNATSRIQAQNMATDHKRFRLEIIEELKGQAAEAAAPAPNPIPKPPAAVAYVPPTPGASCTAQLNWFYDQVDAGHLRAFYDVLPASYQRDIDDLAKTAVMKINPAELQSLHALGELIVTRQRWLFSHPRLKALNETTHERIKDLGLSFGGILRSGFDPTAVNPQRLQSMPIKQLIHERSDAMAPYVAELLRSGSIPARPSVEQVSEKNGVVTLKITTGESSFNTSYTKVDDAWVPSDRAETWSTEIATWKNTINDANPGSLVANLMSSMVPFTAITPILGTLMRAPAEKDFHAAIEPMFAIAQPIVSSLGTLAANTGGRRGRGSSDMMMEDEMMEMMDEDMMEEDMDMDMEMEMQNEEEMRQQM